MHNQSILDMYLVDHLRPRHGRFIWARKAVAAMEFGLLAPVMALLVIGVFDIARVAILWEQVHSASRSIAESASTLALPVTPGAPNNMTWQNAQLALSEIFAEMPWVADGIVTGTATSGNTNSANGTATAVLTSVNYIPQTACQTASAVCCPQGSQNGFCAWVIWSKAYVYPAFNSGSNVVRPCNAALQQVPSGSVTNNQSIDIQAVSSSLQSNGITTPDPFFVADVSITFSPYIFSLLTGSVTLSATSIVPVRIGNPVTSGQQYSQLLDENDKYAGTSSVCTSQLPTGS